MQGVSYIDIGLFMQRVDLLRIMRMFRSNPTRRMIFIVSALRSKNGDFDAQEEEVKEFVRKVYESYDIDEYDEYDNGNESKAFCRDEYED